MLLKEGNCRRKLDWDETAATSFVAVKDTLSEKMLLLYPTLGAPITLIVNALEKDLVLSCNKRWMESSNP